MRHPVASSPSGPHSGAWHVTARLGSVITMGAALLLAVAARGDVEVTDPHEAKAELLYNVAKFIQWPSESFPRDRKEFTFAILGEDEFAAVLAGTMSQKSVNGRPVFVRCVKRAEDARDSQILFIATSEEKRIPEVLAALRGRSVLTVADSGGFAAQGGMLDFVLDDSGVHFEINLDQAQQAQLKISARLLALAHIVANAP